MGGGGQRADEPQQVQLDDLRRLDSCPASWPHRAPALELPASARTRGAPPLRRWQLVRDAVVAWHHARRPEVGAVRAAAVLATLDPVEHEECLAQLAHYRAVVPHGARVDERPEAGTWTDATGSMVVRVAPTFVLSGEVDGPVAVQLRTGRARTDGLASDVLRRTATGAELVEVLLGTRQGVDEVAPPDPGAAAELARLVAQAQALPSPSQRPSRPGVACFTGCRRVPYCGQFPVLGSEVPPPTTSRLVVLSKTALATAARCQRRAAWRSVFHLPPDPEVDDPDDLAATGVGLAVHEVLAALVGSDDHEAAIAACLEAVAPADRASVELLARRHLAIEHDEHPGPLRYRSAERTAGVCFAVRDGAGLPVVVALLAKLDATASEPDGTPAVVEHKTGGIGVPHEDDLYAVVGWHLAARRGGGPPGQLAVHHHWLGRVEPARCARVVHDAAAIAAAEQRLRAIAEAVAAWDPADALSPPPQREHDAHCLHCPFRLRCERHHGPTR